MEDSARRYLIQQRVTSLRCLYEEACGHRDEIKIQLNKVQSELMSLQDQYAAQGILLKDTYRALGYVYINPQFELENILDKIKRLDRIIDTPPPQPIYQTDGLYCINGIYMCKNHPPRQILVNADEMRKHQENVNQAIEEKRQLMRRKEALENYLSLDKGHQELSNKIYEMQYNQDKLMQESREAEQKVNIAQHNLSAAETELQQFDDQSSASPPEATQGPSDKTSRWEQLKQLAEEEVRKEQLKLLAMQEAMQEMMQEMRGQPSQRQDMSEESVPSHSPQTKIERYFSEAEKVVEKVGDKIIDRAIDEAREIGAISEQAKKDLKFIKKFGEKALGRLNEELDEFQQESNPSRFTSQ